MIPTGVENDAQALVRRLLGWHGGYFDSNRGEHAGLQSLVPVAGWLSHLESSVIVCVDVVCLCILSRTAARTTYNMYADNLTCTHPQMSCQLANLKQPDPKRGNPAFLQ